jgi:hypothetical protein
VSPLAVQFLLESVVAPAVLSGLIVIQTRWFRHRVSLVLITAIAFSAAITGTYLMMLGWPLSTALDARQKLYLLTWAGALIGLGFSLDERRSAPLLAALFVLGPLWIGWPALMQGRLDTLLLVLPITASVWLSRQCRRSEDQPSALLWLLVIMAAALATQAFLARTLSLGQLGLALAATLLSIALIGRKPPLPVTAIAGLAMLSGLWSALLLYSEASVPALIVLGGALIAPALARIIIEPGSSRQAHRLGVLMAMAAATAAAAIAWIDAA